MKIWLLVFVNCIQFEATEEKKYPVSCQVINYKEAFKTQKECMAGRKAVLGSDVKNVDSSCVRVAVWRK